MPRNRVQNALRQRKQDEASANQATGQTQEKAYDCFFHRDFLSCCNGSRAAPQVRPGGTPPDAAVPAAGSVVRQISPANHVAVALELAGHAGRGGKQSRAVHYGHGQLRGMVCALFHWVPPFPNASAEAVAGGRPGRLPAPGVRTGGLRPGGPPRPQQQRLWLCRLPWRRYCRPRRRG